jgi:hypothetical protein
MLKIRDDFKIEDLEKYGFKPSFGSNPTYILNCELLCETDEAEVSIDIEYRRVLIYVASLDCHFQDAQTYLPDVIFDMIKDGVIVKDENS